ncbi:hypothetical protein ACGFIU_00865 [Rhodococcus oryzae]|uniref:hypothetical protein n=1 Tax=Rhodococcus oryzae TaxID=2571143 RepID=UPI00371C9A6C
MSAVNYVRALRFTPPWAVGMIGGLGTCVAFLAIPGTGGGRGTIAVDLAIGLAVGVALSVATVYRRRRYHDTATMRAFFAAVDTGRLPEHIDQEQWGAMIGREIAERTFMRSGYWTLLPVAAIFAVNAVINQPHWLYAAITVLYMSQFAWLHVANPRMVASLTSLAAQGQERGYPAITQFR